MQTESTPAMPFYFIKKKGLLVLTFPGQFCDLCYSAELLSSIQLPISVPVSRDLLNLVSLYPETKVTVHYTTQYLTKYFMRGTFSIVLHEYYERHLLEAGNLDIVNIFVFCVQGVDKYRGILQEPILRVS